MTSRAFSISLVNSKDKVICIEIIKDNTRTGIKENACTGSYATPSPHKKYKKLRITGHCDY